jgi:UDP-N-acetyl-D-glucosamine dehydrogenase
VNHEGIVIEEMDEDVALRSADCVVVVTDHRKTDYANISKAARLIVDTRNALKAFPGKNIVRL